MDERFIGMHRCLIRVSFCVVALCVFSINAVAKDILFTEIEKHTKLGWTVSYQSNEPMKAVMFANSPDNSRLKRWLPISSEFSVNYINGREIATRKDGKPFSLVKFQLTPSYIHLPKSYAPFSPFSDGGMLVHSGRFFACPNICSGSENLWAMAIKAPVEDTIIVGSQKYLKKTSWWDKNDGQKFYIGQQQLNYNEDYISIVDAKLTQTVGKQLDTILPRMMSFLEATYGVIENKPMLFASFGETSDGSFGRQGGVLPNQVFMHWYGAATYHEQNPAATLWFFAHEAAHMYQKMAGQAVTPVDNWLHEGHAEMMAKKIMLSLVPQYQHFVEAKVAQAKANCLVIMKSSSLPEQVEAGNYQALYDCGLYIYSSIETAYPKKNGTESLWVALMAQARNGGQLDSNELLLIAQEKYSLSKKDTDDFRRLIGIN